MSLVARVLTRGDINFPSKDSKFIIEDNPGDEWPIHVHIGPSNGNWSIRMHFTYEEFDKLVQKMKDEKAEYGTCY